MQKIYFCLVFLVAGVVLAQNTSDKRKFKNLEAVYAQRKYEADLDKAKKMYEQQRADARKTYAASLKSAQLDETKAGALESAIQIRDEIALLEEAEKATAENDASNQKSKGSPEKGTQSILTNLAGTNWANTRGVTFQWQKDGRLLHSGKERPCFALDTRRVAVVFSESHIDVLLFDEKLTKFEQFNTMGNGKPLMTGKRTSSK